MHRARLISAAQGTEALPHAAAAVRRVADAAPATLKASAAATRCLHVAPLTACRSFATAHPSGGSGGRGGLAARTACGVAPPSPTSASAPAASSASVMSLSDLALAFQQLSHDSAIGAGPSRPIRPAESAAAADDATRAPARRGRRGVGNSSAVSVADGGVSDGVEDGRSAQASRRTPARRDELDELPASARHPHAPREAMLALSAHYTNTLRHFSEAKLRIELEEKVWRYRYSDMTQCVMEVVERLTPSTSAGAHRRRGGGEGHGLTREAAAASPGPAESCVVYSPAALSLMSDHRCLVAVISALNRLDVYAVDTEVYGGGRAGGAAGAATATAAAAAAPTLSERLGHVLLRWLSREVARVDAGTALLLLHLLAQQQLLHGEAVLETLADTIAVHLDRSTVVVERDAAGPTSDEASPAPPTDRFSRGGEPFTLANYAHLLDTMARYQAQLARLAASVSTRAVIARPDRDDGRRDADASGSSNGDRRRGLEDSDGDVDPTTPWLARRERQPARGVDVHHPIANAHLFHHVAEALTRVLQPRPPSPSRSLSAAAPLLTMQSVDFLFLVRALSKLAWWHDGLVAALTPQLSEYLRAHPNAVLVVAALVGRPENANGDAALMRALQESVSVLLRRRLRLATPASGADRALAAVGGDGADDGDADGDDLDAGGVELGDELEEAAAAADGLHWDRSPRDGVELTGSRARLSASAAAPHTSAPASRAPPNAGPPPSTPRGGRLTFVDLHALAGVVESLCRYHVRSLEQCPVASRAELVDGMRSMLRLLLDDAQRGVPSVAAAAELLGPAPLARLLLTLLSATAALRQAWADSAPSATAAAHAWDGLHHPLLVELAYAWTAQVGSRPPPPPPPTSPRAEPTPAAAAAYHRAAGSTQWRRAVAVHHALIEAQLLCRGGDHRGRRGGGDGEWRATAPPRLGARFFMPDDALAAAPRVQAVVQQAKAKINAARARDAQGVAEEEAATAPPERERPRYASGALLGEHSASAAESGRQHQRQRYRAVVVTPARTSDVFAKYTKALARLGC